MKSLQRVALAAVCVSGLTGFRYPTQLPPIAPDVSLPPRFSDQRPAKQLKSGFESLLITNCAYGSLRVGDEDIEPDLALLVASTLRRRFEERLDDKAISLQAFTVHLNNVAALRKQVGSMYTGLIPNLMNKQDKVGCAPDDIRGGYMSGEVPAGAVPLIVAIDMQIDGQLFHARAIAPFGAPYPPGKKADASARQGWNDAVATLVQEVLGQLADHIGQALFNEPGLGKEPLPAGAPPPDSIPGAPAEAVEDATGEAMGEPVAQDAPA